MASELIEALRTRDIKGTRAAIKVSLKEARKPQAVNTAAASVFVPGLDLLVKHGADLNAEWRGYRPLHNLIQTDPHGESEKPTEERLRCLDWMLEHGADPEQPGAWPPARAVIIAAFAGQKEFVERLRRKNDPFAAAALAETKRVAAAIRENPEFPRERDMGGLTALQCAAGSRMPGSFVDTVNVLIEGGADACAKTRSWRHDIDAVYLAASAKKADVFELLIDKGADATEALTPAVWNGNEKLTDIAMSHGADPDRAVADGQPLINNLVRWGAFRQAFLLLKHNASPNIADDRGWTAIHQAASRGNERMLRALIEAGGDITRRDKEGCLPRDRATRDKIAAMLD